MKATAAITKERILRVAENMIRQHGYNKLTMNDIARQAGVSRASLYRCFPYKEKLFCYQTETWLKSIDAALADAMARNEACADKIRAMVLLGVRLLTDGALKLPNIRQEFFSDIAGTLVWLQPAYALLRSRLEEVIIKGASFKKGPAKKASAALALLIQLLQMHVIASHGNKPAFRESDMIHIIDMCVNGMIHSHQTGGVHA
jgi:AcrR family transcriptional regulator